jgi:hypothetical protein
VERIAPPRLELVAVAVCLAATPTRAQTTIEITSPTLLNGQLAHTIPSTTTVIVRDGGL